MDKQQIEFSEAYGNLFNLLDCWTVIKDKGFKRHPKEVQEYWNALSQIDTVLLYGGRDSGKSFAESVFIPTAVKKFNHRVLYTRYTMNSTDQSISEALTERIRLLNYENEFDFANNTYTLKNKEKKGKIFITGQKTSSLNQTAKLKSLEDFSIFVTDEAEEIKTFEEWDKIRKSIRAKDVQCLNMLVFNPPTREHWLFTEFFEDVGIKEGFTGFMDNVLYVHTTYLDNLENIAEHNLKEYKRLKKAYDTYLSLTVEEKDVAPKKLKKDYNKYKHVVLGGFMETAEGVIFEDWEYGEFPENIPSCYGIDFGFSDEDALVRTAVDYSAKKIYVEEKLYKNNIGSNDLGAILIKICGHTDLIVGDAAQKRLINDLYEMGLNIVKCKKGGGSVERGIKTIQGYTIIVCGDSPNVVKSLNNYVWHDKRAGVPRHEWSHIPDAIRYSAMELIIY